MIDPGLALTAFAVLTLATVAVTWPRLGLVARVRRARRLGERVRLEDALKHFYMCERRGTPLTLESLAGRLGVSTVRAALILTHMAHVNLVRVDGDEPELTEEGRRSALQIVRTHRLWERYLADRTNVPATEWHDEAEHMEHTLSVQDVDVLESRLGHPRWDPHGDPIPTAQGEIPPLRGMGLMAAQAGDSVEVLHLEDEPREFYDVLIKHGLAPGERLDVVERTGSGIRLAVAGREWTLDPVTAQNVTVRRLPAGERARETLHTLREAAQGRSVRVTGISAVCQGPQRRRLLDLGVVPGTRITPELVSASGDPVAYRIRGALIALRGEQASWIAVEPADAETEEVA